MLCSFRYSMLILFISFTSVCWGFERIITQSFQISGDITPTTLTLLSFQPSNNEQVLIPYNGDITRLINRFDNYRYIYAAGQGLHAATRIHNVLSL